MTKAQSPSLRIRLIADQVADYLTGLHVAHRLLRLSGAPSAEKMRFQAVFLTGIPAAGKSTYALKKYLKYAEFTNLDADDIKKEHPDYSPANPAMIHEWSKKEMASRFKKAIPQGHPIVIDGTGTDVKKMMGQLQFVKKYKYRATLVFVVVPLAMSKQRNKNPLIEKKHGNCYVTDGQLRDQRMLCEKVYDYLRSFNLNPEPIMAEVEAKGKWGRGRIVPEEVVETKFQQIMEAFKKIRGRFDRVKVIDGR